jgi:hypothetical protein
MIVKKKKDEKKRSFVFVWTEAKKNECNRSSTIEDLPLLVGRKKIVIYSSSAHDGTLCLPALLWFVFINWFSPPSQGFCGLKFM